MTTLKLWGQPRSINVQKVLWALDELDLKFERIDAGGSFGRVKDAEYLALNPNGLVPTLQDGDATLWESNAVVRYLFSKYGSDPIHPRDVVTRGRADAFTDWKSSTLWPPTRVLLVQLVRTPEDKRSDTALKQAKEQATSAFAILDAQLSRTPFVAGEHFTWGDIPVGAVAQRWFNLPIQRPVFKSLEAWYARLAERPAFKRHIDIPLT